MKRTQLMRYQNQKYFRAKLELIGVNPFVSVPGKILLAIFKQAGRDKGHIPIRGTVNSVPYKQTLVKFRGAWRMYINARMLKNSPRRIGEVIKVSAKFDPADRSIKLHPIFAKALKNNPTAQNKFNTLSPSRKHEIVRYISFLKTEESVNRNVIRAINFLSGNARSWAGINPKPKNLT